MTDLLRRIALIAGGLLLLSCAPVSEPWVQGDQYADERDRSAQDLKQLRDRLATSQIDR